MYMGKLTTTVLIAYKNGRFLADLPFEAIISITYSS